ncbi:unnamed protein product [Ilex paraguariensis]|uniref:Uncharacterized protein n=1 Tax=Ilex paraguariensis TaxID=185542 RepID=A0ABC8V5P0_9AQUA
MLSSLAGRTCHRPGRGQILVAAVGTVLHVPIHTLPPSNSHRRKLAGVLVSGSQFGDIASFTNLQFLDLSNNIGLKGTLPPSIGNLKNLTTLMLVGCSFFGPIPDSIGSLQLLVFLALNSNSFSGPIPPSIGNLLNLSWLDLSDNQLNGTIPVSSGPTPGLDMLIKAKHLYALPR